MNAVQVSNYIIDHLNKKGIQITGLHLQKILYYLAAKYYQGRHQLLFEEAFHKWQYGPVCPAVYHAFKGELYISKMAPVYFFDDNFDLQRGRCYPERNGLEKYDNYIDFLAEKKPLALVEKTHEEDAWRSYYESQEGSEIYNNRALNNANVGLK